MLVFHKIKFHIGMMKMLILDLWMVDQTWELKDFKNKLKRIVPHVELDFKLLIIRNGEQHNFTKNPNLLFRIENKGDIIMGQSVICVLLRLMENSKELFMLVKQSKLEHLKLFMIQIWL